MSASDELGSLYIGLMSGTSMDGVDAAVVQFGDRRCEVVATAGLPYTSSLRSALLDAARHPEQLNVDRLCNLDHQVAEMFAQATLDLLAAGGIDREDVTAIGSHGQTIRHQPYADRPFTLQIGDPNIIATITGIKTVADFRRRDMALGGQGAPLAPAFHQWMFGDRPCVVANIGGIANITVLPEDSGDAIGFDTGPGNNLMDAWIAESMSEEFDDNGQWARTGAVNRPLLEALLSDEYFAAEAPKSTGFEYFNPEWLNGILEQCEPGGDVEAADVQATLAELTACTIINAVTRYAPRTKSLLVCGGGAHNSYLMERLSDLGGGGTHNSYLMERPSDLGGGDMSVEPTSTRGVHPDWVEAVAFAWLARQTLHGRPGNLPAVTGARGAVVLGGIYGV
jgi:anhydro-N-acetylmuramic acid kinase